MKKKPGRKATFPTAREADILHLVAECHSHQDIGKKLGMSIRTVENLIYRFMKKADIHKKEYLIQYAQEHGYGRKQASA